jgi:hypothetical protein
LTAQTLVELISLLALPVIHSGTALGCSLNVHRSFVRCNKKVIPFPKSKPAPKVTRQLNLEQMRAKARQALRALEKNNSVAACKLLKELVVE